MVLKISCMAPPYNMPCLTRGFFSVVLQISPLQNMLLGLFIPTPISTSRAEPQATGGLLPHCILLQGQCSQLPQSFWQVLQHLAILKPQDKFPGLAFTAKGLKRWILNPGRETDTTLHFNVIVTPTISVKYSGSR